ncbi:MAG: hypothetical protein WCP21_11975 [Armatimonadota bacterium]
MMKIKVVALLALCIGVTLMLGGCNGSTADFLMARGSWAGENLILDSNKALMSLTDVWADFGGVSTGSDKAAEPFEFWANVTDGAPLDMVGTYTVTGNTVTITATPMVGTTAKQAGDSITMSLDLTSNTTLEGSMTYTHGGDDFTGDINFTRYENQ